ncbi:6387_t:CDS:2 [Funneliformis caledonium]|uniref:6387_t:CDS:1 n=1 Tax=Funneliformis caledonium TaxID=1117310 RepID=A0A9N8ZRX6_9GLOM|nr:6387_t:CDS:2 [Funneliformis caledonium]
MFFTIILEEVKAARETNLIQKELTKSKSDSDYEAKTSQLTFTEGSENNFNSEAKDSSHIILQNITISDISDIIIDDLKADFLKINNNSLSIHLLGTHHITKDIAMKHNEEKLKNPSTPLIKSYHPFK